MQEHEQYCTVAEAAARLQRTEAEIWRMLETGALPAMLRANQTGKDGEPLGFDFATLSPEGVRILADQEGDDFTLEWQACGGHIKATCYPARASSLRVLWEPALFPELMPSEPQAAAHEPAAASTGKAEPPGAATESKAKVKAAPEWKELAQKRAREIIKEYQAKDWYPPQSTIADTIAVEFRRDGVMGTDGKPLSGATLKRHALKGISSAQGRQLSTAPRRGK